MTSRHFSIEWQKNMAGNDNVIPQGFPKEIGHHFAIVLRSYESIMRSCDLYKYTFKTDFKRMITNKVCR